MEAHAFYAAAHACSLARGMYALSKLIKAAKTWTQSAVLLRQKRLHGRPIGRKTLDIIMSCRRDYNRAV
jgi:hypothetical protein